MFRTLLLIPLCLLSLTAAEMPWPDVPDPIGLGPRLATIDWLQERKVIIPADATDAKLIELWAEASGLRAKQRDEEISRRESEEIILKADRLERERIASEKAVALALAHEPVRQGPGAPAGKSSASEVISIAGGKITFVPPNGFAPLPQAILDRKYPAKTAPKYVISNRSAQTTIAYDLKPVDIPQDKMEEARKALTEMMPKMVLNLRWRENKIIELSGVKWIYMEMISSALDTDIHNIMLVTGHNQQMLIINFNSTVTEFSAYEQELQKSIQSITIHK